MADDSPAPVWEQLPDETDKAFAAFRIYRDLNIRDRSYPATAKSYYGEGYKKSPSAKIRQIQDWSSKYHWQSRARAFDKERDRLMLERDLDELRRMREAHITEARGLQSLGIEGLKRIQAKMQKDKTFEISPGLVLQLMQQGAAMERLARGEPTEIQKNLGEKQTVKILWNEDAALEDDDDEDWPYDITPDDSQDAEAPQGPAKDSAE